MCFRRVQCVYRLNVIQVETWNPRMCCMLLKTGFSFLKVQTRLVYNRLLDESCYLWSDSRDILYISTAVMRQRQRVTQLNCLCMFTHILISSSYSVSKVLLPAVAHLNCQKYNRTFIQLDQENWLKKNVEALLIKTKLKTDADVVLRALFEFLVRRIVCSSCFIDLFNNL